LNEKAQVTFPDETEISCVILGEDELGNYKCSALESNGKYKQGDIFYCNEDTHEIVKTAKLTKLSGLKNLLSNEIKKYQWGFDNHKSPWKYNKITGMIEKDPEAVKKLAKLLKTASDETYTSPDRIERYAVEADFYVYATSDEEAFQKADDIQSNFDSITDTESRFEIKNVYKIPTGTMNFNNKPLQRQSKLGGLKFLLSHALDPKIETKFDNSLKAVKYHLFQYSGNDDVKELQTVADYLNDLLMVTKEQIANHHTDERPQHGSPDYDDDGGEMRMWRAMEGGAGD